MYCTCFFMFDRQEELVKLGNASGGVSAVILEFEPNRDCRMRSAAQDDYAPGTAQIQVVLLQQRIINRVRQEQEKFLEDPFIEPRCEQ